MKKETMIVIGVALVILYLVMKGKTATTTGATTSYTASTTPSTSFVWTPDMGA